MKSDHLLSVLLLGMSLSACTHHQAYRDPMSDPAADGSRTIAEPFKCAVAPGPEGEELEIDGENLPLCEHRGHAESSSIQLRHYWSRFRDDPPDEGDYYLSFVEFDDQGWFADRSQMEALFELLGGLEGDALIYVYAHGWKHNASACDSNVICFSRLLERTDLAENKLKGDRTVVGVYLGWRGLPYKAGALNNFSFWSRKEAAARVGRGGVFELLSRLNDYRNNRQGKEPDSGETRLVITGHSFGGLVVYSALAHALMERAARTTTDANGATRYDVAKSFGDFVMLVNPAFEGSLYEPLFHVATNRCYDDEQRPVMMIVTSNVDRATRKAFPMGRTLGTLFQHGRSPAQKRSIRKAIGHDERYQTHDLRKTAEAKVEIQVVDENDDCGCPYLYSTSEWDQESLLTQLFAVVDNVSDPDRPGRYGEEVELVGRQSTLEPPSRYSPEYVSRYPYLVVSADEGVIPDHNAIYTERFINFAQLFLHQHIESASPLPGEALQKTEKQWCWDETPSCSEHLPLPCGQSCRLPDGSPCSVP